MYAFAQRADCEVWDEPFYAAYLSASGADHPMREEILIDGETDPLRVAARCAAPPPGGAPVFYQKHMAHHMLPGFPTGWMSEVRNVFLIRHPVRVVASYVRKRENPDFSDLGFAQQLDLFDRCINLGQDPLVIDSADIRANPEGALKALCAALGLEFDPAMLHWPEGGIPADGIWAAHWYGAVHRSTGFDGPEGDLPRLSGDMGALAQEALPAYAKLRRKRLTF
jgi:hypothetical protein